MRISDWSSDVCSSDLLIAQVDPSVPVLFLETGKHFTETLEYRDALVSQLGLTNLVIITPDIPELSRKDETGLRRSEERRVGKECVSTCRSRWSPYHYKKQPDTQ